MKRESWGSRIGFILAVSGSAIGLANIWRFPHLVGTHGGSAFVLLYLISLGLLGLPLLIGEIAIGRATGKNPKEAFHKIGGRGWGGLGLLTIITGFIVSAFYSAVAGRIVGYFFEALRGNLQNFKTPEAAEKHFTLLLSNPFFTIGVHTLFLAISSIVLLGGIRKGIERSNKILMPLLFLILLTLLVYSLSLPQSDLALHFLWDLDLSKVTAGACLAALGQAFFTLSLGQGTMVTYGSYAPKSENLITTCIPIVLMDTVVSLMSAGVIFSIVFSAGVSADMSGPALIFYTLPVVFSSIPFGALLAPLFFFLVTLAALTSEVSALEPSITYLVDEKGYSRAKALSLVAGGSYLIGIPCALDGSFFDFVVTLSSTVLIPIGGLSSALLIGWKWRKEDFFKELGSSLDRTSKKLFFLKNSLYLSLKYIAPVLIGIIFLNALFAG